VTKTGLVVGTPEYMSPEQLSGDKLDGRSDIYSLALVAFNMLTGTLPFPSDSQQESMIMRLTDRPKSLAEMMPDRVWPPNVQSVMDKALERDVNARYQNATDFGMALYTAIDRMPEGSPAAAVDLGAATVVAIPPTRISSAALGRDAVAAEPIAEALSSSDAATVIVTPKNFGPSVGPGTAPEKKPNKIGLYATAAGVILAGAIAAKFFLGGPAPQARVADTTTPRDTTAGVGVVNAGLPANATALSKVDSAKIAPNPGRSSSAPVGSAAAQASNQSVSEQLSELVDDSRDRSKGSGVLRKLAVIEPRVQSSPDWLVFGSLKANVAKAKGDDGGACAALKAILPKLDSADLVSLQDRLPTYPNCVLPE
jgi:hypothetical protein